LLVALSVLIVDDHAGFRTMARLLLEDQGCRVVGEAADGRTAIAAAAALHPHVVLLDIGLPDMDGFAVAKAIHDQESPGQDVVLCSSRSEAEYRAAVARSSARGFNAKSDLSASALLRLVRPD